MIKAISRHVKILHLTMLLMTTSIAVQAQEMYNTDVPRDIIIIKSTKVYRMALATARQAADHLHKTLDLRRLRPDPKLGLTLSKADCYGSGGSDEYGFPCYIARGDGAAANDDYISVEYSDAYKGFAKGYYIIVAAIGATRSSDLRKDLEAIRRSYPDAYAKRTYVWFGCMH